MPFPSDPFWESITAYVTDFPGQGPTLRIVYYSFDGHIREIFYVHASHTWGAADLTSITETALANYAHGRLVAYTTDFPNQGPTARVMYASNLDGHIWELSLVASEGIWRAADLTAISGAPAFAPPLTGGYAPTTYVTNFPNQGPTIRAVFVGPNQHLWELSHVASTQTWRAADLTALTGSIQTRSGTGVDGRFIPYVTDFPGQGPTVRLVYVGLDKHIHELLHVASSGTWSAADLTAIANAAPAESIEAAYLTDFPGQGPTARLVYWNSDHHIRELYFLLSNPMWRSADLTAISGAGPVTLNGRVTAYVTDFPGQGPTARLVYVSTDGHIRQLFLLASTQIWGAADLTALTAPHSALSSPHFKLIAHVTDFAGQGPIARIVYTSQTDQHVRELFLLTSSQTWGAADLTVLTSAPPAQPSSGAGPGGPNVILYNTDFVAEGPTARLAYVDDTNNNIVELRCLASTHQWTAVDISVQANAP